MRARGGLSSLVFALGVDDFLRSFHGDAKKLGDLFRFAGGLASFAVEVMRVFPRFEFRTLHRTFNNFACERLVSTASRVEKLVVIREFEKVLKFHEVTIRDPPFHVTDFYGSIHGHVEVADAPSFELVFRDFDFEGIRHGFVLADSFHRIYLSIFPTDPRKRIPVT